MGSSKNASTQKGPKKDKKDKKDVDIKASRYRNLQEINEHHEFLY